MDSPRPSAAVVLTRGDGRDLEVFLVQRSPALRFLGGFWAFPGGVVDPMDRLRPGEDDGVVLARCAIRELFEETDVLPAPLARELDFERRRSLREALLTPGTRVEEWIERLDASPEALAAVRPFCGLVTPPFSRRRYRTRFHHLALPEGEVPGFAEGELVDGRFWKPGDAVDAWRKGRVQISPPTVLQLGLHEGSALEDWLAACGRECGKIEAGRLEAALQAPGVTALPLRTPTVPPALSTCTYLVGHERVWIVDPAPEDEGEQARMFEIVDEWRDAGRRLEGILLTHHHPDHVGAVEVTARRYGLAVHAHPWTLEHLAVRPAEAVALDDGDELELGAAPDGTPGWKLLVLHTPGHAPGHLAFIESRYRSAIVGDLVSTASTIVIDPPEGHLATYLASLERLAGMEIGALHPAHGIHFHDGSILIGRYLEHRREREGRLLDALGAVPASEDELLAAVYDDTPEEQWPIARRSLFAGLEKLVEEGRVEAAGPGWRATAHP